MDHILIESIEKALGWNDSRPLGAGFAHGRMGDPKVCQRILTPTRLLDVIMRRALAFPQFRVFQHGEELHPDRYLRNTVTRRGQSLSMARMERLSRFLTDGCTLVLDTLDSFDPTMEIACQALQWWSRELVQVNTYLTTADAAGFNLHWDDHEVLIVQLGGEKSWEVRGTSRVAPMYRDTEHSGEPPEEIVWSGTMRAGDVMHIPRGYWHQATRTDRSGDGAGYSLHATFGFVKRTGVDWLSWVADRSRTDEVFRHDLDRDGSSAALAERVPQLLAQYPQEVFLPTREQERSSRRHVRTGGIFGPITDVVCVTDFPPRIDVTDSTVEVLAVGKQLTFAARAEPALRRLLSGNPVNVEQVAEATGVDAAVLARTLLDEGLCGELTDELAAGYIGAGSRTP
ncbi:cupin domain-containing protein [Saccharopolyspora shandongensis]|uniref:JmjC domain-containing protein n=1 Tax=Saccharopolyspora shandongensis TaxID=418495 RepID=UPI00341A55D2